MNKKLLQEHIYRVGIITLDELKKQAGAARNLLEEILPSLIEQREFFCCRMLRGEITFISRHLLYCMRAVCCEVTIAEDAQNIYDWLSENEGATLSQMLDASKLDDYTFAEAVKDLQSSLMMGPLKLCRNSVGNLVELPQEDGGTDYHWCTDEYWLSGLDKPTRYNDLGYCLSELKRMLCGQFSTREINNIIYRNQRELLK